MIVEAVAAVARVARGGVHTHSALAHLVLEELAFINICRKRRRQMKAGVGVIWGRQASVGQPVTAEEDSNGTQKLRQGKTGTRGELEAGETLKRVKVKYRKWSQVR